MSEINNSKKILTPRDISSMQKKEKIFNTALALFKEFGYNNVTMKMISKESGISEGSIYHFFGEKAMILSLLSMQIQKEVSPLVEPTEENLSKPYEALYNYMMARSDAYEALGTELLKVFCSIPSQHKGNSNITDFISKILYGQEALCIFVDKAIKLGTLKIDIDPKEFSFILTNAGSGLVFTWSVHGEGYSLHDASEKTFKALLDMFAR